MKQTWAQRLFGRLGKAALWLLVVLPPLLVAPTAENAFRLPKLVASETLALVSILFLSWRWWSGRRLSLRTILGRPATVFAVLLAFGAAAGLFVAEHPGHGSRALVSLLIGLACVVAWSLHLRRDELRRCLFLLVAPATVLSVLAILQRHRLYDPFQFQALEGGRRFALSSLAGNVGDLAAYLVLPVLLAQAGVLARAGALARSTMMVVLAILGYTLVLTQTLSALVAVLAGSVVFWWVVLAPRRRWALIALAPLVAAGMAMAPGLRWRVQAKIHQLTEGRLSELLSGRPDAWKAALAMFGEEPLTGVGHGGFAPHFAPTKLRLLAAGERFFSLGDTASFANAHSEYLEVAAEWGLLGLLALAGALAVAGWRLARLSSRGVVREERALALGGCTALAVLSLAAFPLRVALTAYPWLLFAAWLFARRCGKEGREGRGRLRGWHLAALSSLLLVPGLVLVARGGMGRLEASRILRATSQTAQLALERGQLSRSLLQANLRLLRRARDLDALEVGIPMTAGSHYLLLGNSAAAAEWYRRAMEVEPKPNLYLNLARALLMSGREEEAAAYLDAAVALDPSLRQEAAALGWSP